jgi:hypothetical protein
MRRRFSSSATAREPVTSASGQIAGELSLAVAVFALLAAMPTVAALAQGGGASADNYTVPRTSFGQPDIQGFWTNATYTPLERPDGVTAELYTSEELAARLNAAAERESSQTEPGTVPDVHYDFTQFGLDRSQSTFARSLRTSLIVDPLNGEIPPMTEEGVARNAGLAASRGGRFDSVQDNQLDDRCIIMRGAGPPMMDAGYNANYQVVQMPGYVMILTEMIHDVRMIPLDGRVQAHSNVRQWMGTSRGRWDGDTLVIETENFNGKNPFRGSSENMRVTERLTRVADDEINYRFTIEDESTWPMPWTAELSMVATQGPLFEHACHEGNYGLYNTLLGTRLEEQRAREEAKAAQADNAAQ